MTIENIDPSDGQEFAHLPASAARVGLRWPGSAAVRRETLELADGHLSYLAWGDGPAELVLLHGRGQNAHTWDTVLLALGASAIAIDLPGHGHSSWRDDSDYRPERLESVVIEAIEQLAPQSKALIGMSLGGLTSIRVSARRPDLFRRLVLVDVTPHVRARQPGRILDENDPTRLLAGGPVSFPSFEAMLDDVAANLPTRAKEALRVGVRHNSRRLDDGSWTWRYDRRPRLDTSIAVDESSLWDDLSAITCPILLVLGGRSRHVEAADLEAFTSRQPDALITTVEGASHSVQSDFPLELALLLADFLGIPEPVRDPIAP